MRDDVREIWERERENASLSSFFFFFQILFYFILFKNNDFLLF